MASTMDLPSLSLRVGAARTGEGGGEVLPRWRSLGMGGRGGGVRKVPLPANPSRGGGGSAREVQLREGGEGGCIGRGEGAMGGGATTVVVATAAQVETEAKGGVGSVDGFLLMGANSLTSLIALPERAKVSLRAKETEGLVTRTPVLQTLAVGGTMEGAKVEGAVMMDGAAWVAVVAIQAGPCMVRGASGAMGTGW